MEYIRSSKKEIADRFIEEFGERELDIEKQIIEEKIRNSKYNRKYNSIIFR